MPIEYCDRPTGSESKINTVSDGIRVIAMISTLSRMNCSKFVVHRIHNDQHQNPENHLANAIDGLEDGHQVHPRGDDDAPQVHNITEKYGKRREQHAQAHAKAHEREQANQQQD